MNKVLLLGRIGSDIELRTVSEKSVINFSLATSKKVKDEDRTEWHRIVFWGKLAEVIQKYCAKGDQIFIEGEITSRKWTDKSGVERTSTEILGNHFEFGAKSNRAAKPAAGPFQETPSDDSSYPF